MQTAITPKSNNPAFSFFNSADSGKKANGINGNHHMGKAAITESQTIPLSTASFTFSSIAPCPNGFVDGVPCSKLEERTGKNNSKGKKITADSFIHRHITLVRQVCKANIRIIGSNAKKDGWRIRVAIETRLISRGKFNLGEVIISTKTNEKKMNAQNECSTTVLK